MQLEQYEDVLAKVKLALSEPLDYRVASAYAVMRDAPSELGVELGRLECGSIVRGFPTGGWFFVEQNEAEEWLVGSSNSQVPGGAWLRLDDSNSGYARLLVPQWAAMSMTGLEVAWPGLPQAAAATYVFEWRLPGPDAKKGSMQVGRSLSAQLPKEQADANGLQVRVAAVLPDGLRLLSPWGKPQEVLQKARRHPARKQAADVVGSVISVHVENRKQNSFDGCWVNEDDVPVATIINGVVSWANGPSAEMKQQSKEGFSVTLEGFAGDLQAMCTADGNLTWSDGDVWKRAGNSAERRGNFGAGGAGYAQRGDGFIHFHPTKKCGGRRQFSKDDLDQPPDGGMMVHNAPTYMVDMVGEPGNVDILNSSFAQQWMSWQNVWGALGPDAPEEVPRIRLLYNSNSRVVLLELFSAATTNMMDSEMCADMYAAQDAMRTFVKERSHPGERTPLSLVYQGVGPHFSPGGNHHPLALENATPLYFHTWYSTYHMDSAQQLGIPQIVCQHGACVGGGAAQSLSSSSRALDNRMSLSFGNLSRGATPIMMLSSHLPNTIGRPNAVSIYLTDDTFSAYTAMMGGWSRAVFNGVPNLKLNGNLIAQRYAKTGATECHAIKIHAEHCMDHAAREAYGFIAGFRSAGGQFQSTKKQAKTDAIEAKQDAKDPNNLTISVPENNNKLWAMKMMIEETWKIPVEDQVLVTEDGTVLDDGDMLITEDTKVQLRLTEYATAKAEWDQWQQSTEDDYEDYGDYDYDWDDDEDEEDEEE